MALVVEKCPLEEVAERSAGAAWELGSRYSSSVGLGLHRDDAEAMAWYKKGAIAGDFRAEHNYAVMLQRQEDCAEALLWYEKSATQGNASSDHALGRLFHAGFQDSSGRRVRDLAKAKAYYTAALKRGWADAGPDLERLERDLHVLEDHS